MSTNFDMRDMLEGLNEVKYDFNEINEALAENTLITLKLNIKKQLLVLRKLFAQWAKVKGQTKSLRISSRSAVKKSEFGTASRINKGVKIVDEILVIVSSFKKSLGLELFMTAMCLRDPSGKLIKKEDSLQKYIKPNGEFNLAKSNAKSIRQIKKNPEFMNLYNQYLVKLNQIEKFVLANKETGLVSKSIKEVSTLLRDDNVMMMSPSKLSPLRQSSISPKIGKTRAMNINSHSLSPKVASKKLRK